MAEIPQKVTYNSTKMFEQNGKTIGVKLANVNILEAKKNNYKHVLMQHHERKCFSCRYDRMRFCYLQAPKSVCKYPMPESSIARPIFILLERLKVYGPIDC